MRTGRGELGTWGVGLVTQYVSGDGAMSASFLGPAVEVFGRGLFWDVDIAINEWM